MSTIQSQEWTAAGNYTWTVPSGITSCWVNVLGGGGGAYSSSPGSNFGGTGGGASEQACNVPVKVTSGGTVAVTVGAGGIGSFFTFGPYTNHQPTRGGNSSFGSVNVLGAGNGETGGVPFPPAQTNSSYGGGTNGGLQGNRTFPNFSETFPFADASLWFGGSGGGTGVDVNITPGGNGMNGGPAGGRAFGGTGGVFQTPVGDGPGGGGAATLYGIGADGSIEHLNGANSTIAGTGGGGAGGYTGTGPNFFENTSGGNGSDGYVCVFWIS